MHLDQIYTPEDARHVFDVIGGFMKKIAYRMDEDGNSSPSPMIPEVLILQHADKLDCELEMYVRCLRKDVADGAFTDRDPMLGKRLLKEREL